jgi:CDP-6-deoxy-D-xylo-4-hexulose-3-dehydrase
MDKDQIKQQILQLVAQYAELATKPTEFVPGNSVVPPSGKVIGASEMQNMVEASLACLMH